MKLKEVFKAAIPILEIILIVGNFTLKYFGLNNTAENLLLVGLIIGYIPLIYSVFKSLLSKNIGIDLLALLSIGGSLLIGEYLAGVIIVLMLSGGEFLEEFALKRSRKELTKLVESIPKFANLKRSGKLVLVPLNEIKLNQVITIKPGEVIPLDGIIVQGKASINEANLTGESLPLQKRLGDKVYSGTTNLDGDLQVKVTANIHNSKYQILVELVKEAVEAKAPFVRMADRYSIWFTILAITLTIFGYILSGGDAQIALSVLVVATPCPLILATPIAFNSGVSIAAAKGAVFKSGQSIEKLNLINYLVFDKTGTLTKGEPHLDEIIWLDPTKETQVRKEKLFQIIASLEQYSGHILSKSLIKLHSDNSDWLLVENFKEEFGKGISGTINEIEYFIGSAKFILEKGVNIDQEFLQDKSGTIKVFVVKNRIPLALLKLKDEPRERSQEVLLHLHEHEKISTIMLTGDKYETAKEMAKHFGIEDFRAECLPEDKLNLIREIQKEGKKVAMIGDGINDSPAIAQADVGIALGNLGTSASTEAADIILTNSNLNLIPELIHISKRVIEVAKQGILLGIGLSVILMIIAVFGFLTPTVGALLQEVIDVLVIFNALRARRI